jgi:uncharacterized membrane protein YccC
VSATRATLRESFTLDASLVTPVAGAITALPVVGIFILGLALSTPRTAIALAIGANLVAVVSLVGAPKLSLSLAAMDAVTMGVGVFVGTVTSPYTWLHDVLLVPWCFGAGLMVVLGQTQGAIGTQAIIAYVVLGRFAGSPGLAVHLALLVVLGALVEVLALLVLRLPPSLRYQRLRLANAFQALADYAREEPRHSAIGALSTLDDAERALAVRSLFGRTDMRDLRAIFDQLRRTRLELTTLSGLRVRLSELDAGNELAEINEAVSAVSVALAELGATLRRPLRGTTSLTAATFRSPFAVPAPAEGALDVDVIAHQCATHLVAIAGQIRSSAKLITTAGRDDGRRAWQLRLPEWQGPDLGRLRNDASLLRASLRPDAPGFRHAVRLAIAVTTATMLASWLSLPRGYWLPFSVAVILKPDYSTLLRRGVGRIVGTAFGASMAAVIVSELHPDAAFTAVLVGLCAWAAYATWAASFSVAMGFITALVIVLLSMSLPNAVSTALDRLLDVTLGGVIAVISYRIWPTSPRAGVSQAQSDLFAALVRYLAAVAPAVAGQPVEPVTLAAASRASRLAWAKAETAVGRSIEEPSATRINPTEGRGLLAAGMRILRATHALRIEAEAGATVAPSNEYRELVDGCLTSLQRLSDHFADLAGALPQDLRDRYRASEPALSAGGAPSVSVHFDELVNAINTATHLIGTRVAD